MIKKSTFLQKSHFYCCFTFIGLTTILWSATQKICPPAFNNKNTGRAVILKMRTSTLKSVYLNMWTATDVHREQSKIKNLKKMYQFKAYFFRSYPNHYLAKLLMFLLFRSAMSNNTFAFATVVANKWGHSPHFCKSISSV